MIKGMTIGNRGSKVSLLLGLTLGVVAAVLIAAYLTGAKGDEGGGSLSGPTVPVVVASQNISAGTRITAEMLAVKDVLDTSVVTGAFTETELLVGQVTVVPVVAGEQVIPEKVTATGNAAVSQYGENPPLSLLLEPGQRAVSVEMSTLAGAGGNIRPGDYIDVILSVKTESPAGKDQIAATILQNLKVLAIDQSIASLDPAPDANSAETEGTAKGSISTATTVTLAATPVQGEVLALADQCRQTFEGRLAMALRGFGDHGTIARAEWPADGAPPNCAALLGIAGLP